MRPRVTLATAILLGVTIPAAKRMPKVASRPEVTAVELNAADARTAHNANEDAKRNWRKARRAQRDAKKKGGAA